MDLFAVHIAKLAVMAYNVIKTLKKQEREL